MTERAMLADPDLLYRLYCAIQWAESHPHEAKQQMSFTLPDLRRLVAALRTEPAAATTALVAQWDAAVMDSAASPEIVEAGNRLAKAVLAAAPREPDGWITEWRYRNIPDSWREPTFYESRDSAEAVVNRRARRDGEHGYPMRIRPVYFDAPGAAPVPDAEMLDALRKLADMPPREGMSAYEAGVFDGRRALALDVIDRLPAATERTQQGTDAD